MIGVPAATPAFSSRRGRFIETRFALLRRNWDSVALQNGKVALI
jgi:hypothetical protein